MVKVVRVKLSAGLYLLHGDQNPLQRPRMVTPVQAALTEMPEVTKRVYGRGILALHEMSCTIVGGQFETDAPKVPSVF